jgi:mannose-6-phosphate isomerase-like protein (cupin superfamily)
VWKYSPVNWRRRPRHFHIEPELNLIASGQATFGIGENVVRVSQGDLLGFPAARDHVLQCHRIFQLAPRAVFFRAGLREHMQQAYDP